MISCAVCTSLGIPFLLSLFLPWYGFMVEGKWRWLFSSMLANLADTSNPSYIEGGADSFAGSDLMREANNEIVAVIIQYRLGLFGTCGPFNLSATSPSLGSTKRLYQASFPDLKSRPMAISMQDCVRLFCLRLVHRDIELFLFF